MAGRISPLSSRCWRKGLTSLSAFVAKFFMDTIVESFVRICGCYFVLFVVLFVVVKNE